jgi:hypothetical protein
MKARADRTGWVARARAGYCLTMRRLVGATGHRQPNAATPFVVPTYTRPLTMVGVMNLFPGPNASRPAAAWFEL